MSDPCYGINTATIKGQMNWMACKVSLDFVHTADWFAENDAKKLNLRGTARKCKRASQENGKRWTDKIQPEINRGSFSRQDLNVVEGHYNEAYKLHLECYRGIHLGKAAGMNIFVLNRIGRFAGDSAKSAALQYLNDSALSAKTEMEQTTTIEGIKEVYSGLLKEGKKVSAFIKTEDPDDSARDQIKRERLSLKGYFLQKAGKLDEAKEMYKAALKLWHKDMPAVLGLAQIAEQEGEYKSALKLREYYWDLVEEDNYHGPSSLEDVDNAEKEVRRLKNTISAIKKAEKAGKQEITVDQVKEALFRELSDRLGRFGVKFSGNAEFVFKVSLGGKAVLSGYHCSSSINIWKKTPGKFVPLRTNGLIGKLNSIAWRLNGVYRGDPEITVRIENFDPASN